MGGVAALVMAIIGVASFYLNRPAYETLYKSEERCRERVYSDVKATYKKIRMNSYAFPEHVVISEAARDLISKILIGDPT